ncbi:hypothetical protein [Caulobacter sp. Root342]
MLLGWVSRPGPLHRRSAVPLPLRGGRWNPRAPACG